MKIHLKKLLKSRRITQSQLAKDTGINPRLISKMYNQTIIQIPIESIDLICEYLDITIDQLLVIEKRVN